MVPTIKKLHNEADHRVLLEGLTVSKWSIERLASLPELHTIHLTTPLEKCLDAVVQRRNARANAKSMELQPLNPKNTERGYFACQSSTRRQRDWGMKVEELDRDAARARVFELLGLEQA